MAKALLNDFKKKKKKILSGLGFSPINAIAERIRRSLRGEMPTDNFVSDHLPCGNIIFSL